MERRIRRVDDRRSTVDLQATCATGGSAPTFSGRVTQISTTGFRLRTDRKLTLGASIHIALVDDDPRKVFQAARFARVVRALPGFQPAFEYRLTFISDRELLRAFRKSGLALVA